MNARRLTRLAIAFVAHVAALQSLAQSPPKAVMDGAVRAADVLSERIPQALMQVEPPDAHQKGPKFTWSFTFDNCNVATREPAGEFFHFSIGGQSGANSPEALRNMIPANAVARYYTTPGEREAFVRMAARELRLDVEGWEFKELPERDELHPLTRTAMLCELTSGYEAADGNQFNLKFDTYHVVVLYATYINAFTAEPPPTDPTSPEQAIAAVRSIVEEENTRRSAQGGRRLEWPDEQGQLTRIGTMCTRVEENAYLDPRVRERIVKRRLRLTYTLGGDGWIAGVDVETGGVTYFHTTLGSRMPDPLHDDSIVAARDQDQSRPRLLLTGLLAVGALLGSWVIVRTRRAWAKN